MTLLREQGMTLKIVLLLKESDKFVQKELDLEKKGKLVTVIKGLELEQVEAKKILKNLKIACGTGGAVKGDLLELQGDQISKAQDFLLKEGFRPKQSGGQQ